MCRSVTGKQDSTSISGGLYYCMAIQLNCFMTHIVFTRGTIHLKVYHYFIGESKDYRNRTHFISICVWYTDYFSFGIASQVVKICSLIYLLLSMNSCYLLGYNLILIIFSIKPLPSNMAIVVIIFFLYLQGFYTLLLYWNEDILLHSLPEILFTVLSVE